MAKTRGVIIKRRPAVAVRSKLRKRTSLGRRLRAINPVPRAPPINRDEDALKYLALISDPCNGELVPPTYAGEGSGLFLRTKTMISPGASAVDSILQFGPSQINENSQGQNANGFGGPILYASSNSSGGGLSNVYGESIAPTYFGFEPSSAGVAGAARCIAACVKVHYLGSELNRAGIVYAGLLSSPIFTDATSVTLSPVATLGNALGQIDRVGSRVHEYKWLPSFGDEQFIKLAQSDITDTVQNRPDGNSLVVAVSGAYAGSIMYEVTACWEYNVNVLDNVGIVSTMNVSRSACTLNDVLRSIGDVGAFCLSPEGGKRIQGLVGGALTTIRSASKMAAAFATVL